jgi:Na+/melibiose symporter-like transporter
MVCRTITQMSDITQWLLERHDPNIRWICGICISLLILMLFLCLYDLSFQGISFDSGKILAPYKIIYLLLGGLAIVVGICVLIWLPDSPVHARMLTREERIAVLERVRDDQGGTENKIIKRDQIIEALFDIRTWLIVLTTMLSTPYTSPDAKRFDVDGHSLTASIPNGALSNCESLSYRTSSGI